MHRRQFVTGSALLALTACGEFPVYQKPKVKLPAQFGSNQLSNSVTLKDARWWYSFDDPALNKLVEVGLNQNLDIRKAVARIQQSQGVLDASGYPYSGAIRVGEVKVNNASDSNRAGSGFARAEASWRLDLFDKLENEIRSSQAGLDAAYEDADIWRLTLLTDILGAYIDVRFAQELLRVNKNVTRSREATLEATRNMDDEDPQKRIAVAQSEALLANSRAAKPELEVQFVRFINRIMVLAGVTQLPNRAQIDRGAPQPEPKSKIVQTGVPADLLRNRPDIVRAERRFEQAMAAVGIAHADLYPDLVLTGNIALNDNSSGPVISAGFLRLGLDVPLFDLPERRGKKAAAQALAEERRLEWEKQVLQAVEEVRNAMFAMERHRLAILEAEAGLKASKNVLKIAREMFQAGQVTFLQVQDAERAFLNAENALALDKRNYAVDYVSLNVALGGRYSPKKQKAS